VQAKPGSRRKYSVSGRPSPQLSAPSPSAGWARRTASAARYSDSVGAGSAGPGLDGQVRPFRRDRQPRRGAAGRAEAERRRRPDPRQRHPAAVPAPLGTAGPLPHRVSEHARRRILHLRQAQLLALVQVRGAGHEGEQRGGPGPRAGRRRPRRTGCGGGGRRGWTAPRWARRRPSWPPAATPRSRVPRPAPRSRRWGVDVEGQVPLAVRHPGPGRAAAVPGQVPVVGLVAGGAPRAPPGTTSAGRRSVRHLPAVGSCARLAQGGLRVKVPR
jgi:hypothetical protein